jgi:hypothetical protein
MNVSLKNLVGVSLETITPDRATVQRLLVGAVRHIADSKVAAVSAETRFTAAYTAIRILADVEGSMGSDSIDLESF